MNELHIEEEQNNDKIINYLQSKTEFKQNE